MSRAATLLDLPDPGGFPLPETSPRAQPQSLLKRLSSRHHRLAQLLAEGVPPGEAGIACGYTASRVSVLQTDIPFKALVAFYASQRQQAFIATGQKLADVADTALDILQDRLEDNPNEFSPTQLLAVITTAADRSGHGPMSTQRNVNVNLSAEQLASLKASVLATQPGTVQLLPAQQGGKAAAEAPDDGSGPAETPEPGS